MSPVNQIAPGDAARDGEGSRDFPESKLGAEVSASASFFHELTKGGQHAQSHHPHLEILRPAMISKQNTPNNDRLPVGEPIASMGAEVAANPPVPFGGWVRKQNRGRKPGRWSEEQKAALRERKKR